jgi:hypothetical protein
MGLWPIRPPDGPISATGLVSRRKDDSEGEGGQGGGGVVKQQTM